MIRGAIFDADGTLLDSMPMWGRTGELYLNSLGIQAEPHLNERLFAMSPPQSAAYLRKTYRLPLHEEEVRAGVNAIIREFYRTQVCLKEGVQGFLEGLKQQGVRMTLATATDESAIVEGLKHTGILDYFSAIFTSGNIGVGKEKPNIFWAAQAHMQTEAAETWVFEDAVHAARTARQAGFRVAGVYDAHSDIHQNTLKSLSHVYLPILSDFETFYQTAMEYD